jgi:PhnB protein
MVSEENPQYNKSPKTLNGTSVNICLYVPDVDATMAKAAEKGAAIITPAADQFYGDRSGRLEDPYGYIWIVSTYKKHLSPVAMQKMMDEMMKQS